MPGQDQLSALVAIVREGSFDAAARQLHVTPSAVSQRIKQLEEDLGGVLVVRGAPCTLTALGSRVYRHAQQVELLERDLLRAVGSPSTQAAGSSSPITVAVNADSLATWLVPAVARFAERTGTRVELVVDDQDHTAEWLRSGRVLGAVTAQARPVQGCRVRSLGVMRYRATASPAFARRWFAKGMTREALRAAPALSFNRKDRLQERFARQVLGSSVESMRPHFLPSPQAFVEATLSGMGWGMNPELLVRTHLGRQRLADLTPGKSLDVPLFWQHWSLASETLENLSSALSEQAARTLGPLESG